MNLPGLSDIVALLTIASVLIAAFNYIVIKPLQLAIKENSDILQRLREELDDSAKDRRVLDSRVSALEAKQELNSKRITHVEVMLENAYKKA